MQKLMPKRVEKTFQGSMTTITQKIKELITTELNNTVKKHSTGTRKAKILAVCSQKGGVGKTTTAVNLSSALVKFYNKKVLVTDLDPQGHVEKSLSALIEEGVDYKPLSDILLARHGQILDGVVKTKHENLHITPGDKTLYETEGQLASKIGRELILFNSFEAAKTHYDYIIIDCPPNLGNLTVNALCAADYVVIPCEMSVLAFEGVSDLLETVATINQRLNKKLKILGVLFTRVDGRNISMNSLVEDNMRKMFKGKIFKSQVAVNTDLNKSQLEGEPIFDYAPHSTGAANYKTLAGEIINRVGEVKNKAAKTSSDPAVLN
ncbi:MAG: ParA family protein [Deltaproteobacteria bacterium]|nr:ParA family protein [Deltaproteobacteria bacterium]